MSDKLLEAIGGISEQFIAECDDYISQRKASHRRRKLTRVTALCAAVIAGAALLTGAVYSIFRVSFPNSFANRTEHSAAIYDIEPFRMSIQLPAGCVTCYSASINTPCSVPARYIPHIRTESGVKARQGLSSFSAARSAAK